MSLLLISNHHLNHFHLARVIFTQNDARDFGRNRREFYTGAHGRFGRQNEFSSRQRRVAITRPWVNPWGERERRGRFLASAASIANDTSRASHKTDRSRGHEKIQNRYKTTVNKGRFEFNAPPHVGKGVGIP